MVAIGLGIVWWGYLQTIYGYCLLKGFDITWRQLADPIHPYEWPRPPATPPLIPPTQIMPGKAPSSTQTQTTQTMAQQQPGSTLPPGSPPKPVDIGNLFPKIFPAPPPPGRQPNAP